MEYRQPTRDVPAPRPNRLEAALQPPAGVRFLGTRAYQSLGLHCHQPSYRSVTSHQPQLRRLLRRNDFPFEASPGTWQRHVPSKRHALDGSSSLIKPAQFFTPPSSLKSRTSRGLTPTPPSHLLLG
jgi:hypothetical protein